MAHVRVCVHCGDPLGERRSDAVTCGRRCRARVARRRRRGLPPDAFPQGVPRRGRVPMNEPTRLEQLRTALEIDLLSQAVERLNDGLLERGADEEKATVFANGVAELMRPAA